MSPNTRRPLRADELPHLRAMGQELRRLRAQAGVSAGYVGAVAYITTRQVERIEQGARRTRRSTLERIVAVLLLAAPDLGEREVIVQRLVTLAGPALAVESPYALKSAERRQGKRLRLEARRAMYAHLREWGGPGLEGVVVRVPDVDHSEPVRVLRDDPPHDD